MNKLFILLFIFSFSCVSFSKEFISQKVEGEILNQLVNSLETRAWNNGHDQIESELEFFTLERFDKFLSEEHRFMEDQLLESEIFNIISCMNEESCSVYKINISTEYYSGYGFDYHFVFINRFDGTYTKNKYAGYNE